jgi:hypothetical protein
VLHTVPAFLVFTVVLESMEDSGQVLRFLPIVERYQFQKGVERQRRQRQRRAIVDGRGDALETTWRNPDTFMMTPSCSWSRPSGAIDSLNGSMSTRPPEGC